MTQENLTWFTLVVAAVAAVAGPVATIVVGQRTRTAMLRANERQASAGLEVARRQIHGSVVSSNRQKWIDAVREDISEFITERQFLAARQQDNDRDIKVIQQSTKRLILLYHRLALRLNPTEDDHQQLLKMADYYAGRPNSLPQEPDMDGMVALSQKILKREWEVIKNGD